MKTIYTIPSLCIFFIILSYKVYIMAVNISNTGSYGVTQNLFLSYSSVTKLIIK